MKIKFLNKKDKDKSRVLKQKENITDKKEAAEITKKERNIFQIPGFKQYNALMKLRIAVSLIFFLCTISMILIFVGGWVISAILLLIGYVLLFILMIKLFMTKRL
ncbi:Uncharacterised protein [uncultured archaeon]|nr:Uncharacterised protein [uncultured archaeon]